MKQKNMIEELIPQEGDCILCVKVGKVARENIYEMARKYWVLDGKRASKATHMLAIIDGIVDSVIIPSVCKLTEDPAHEGRWEFEGVLDNKSAYIGKSVKSFYGQGSNPVKYINM